MAVEYQVTDDVVRVFIRGEIDHHRTLTLRKEIDEILLAHRPERVLLDLSGTDFCDSSGLGLILGRVRVAESIGAKVELESVSNRVRKVLDAAGARQFLHYA